MRRIEATYSTIGQSSVRGAGGWYRWNGDPGKSEAARTGTAPPKRAAGSGGEANSARRQERLEKFKAALAELGHPDPVEAPSKTVIKAGEMIGVGPKTARSYRAQLERQRQCEEAAAMRAVIGEDAEPGEIVAALRAKIAGFSPAHARLVAQFEQLQAGARQP